MKRACMIVFEEWLLEKDKRDELVLIFLKGHSKNYIKLMSGLDYTCETQKWTPQQDDVHFWYRIFLFELKILLQLIRWSYLCFGYTHDLLRCGI